MTYLPKTKLKIYLLATSSFYFFFILILSITQKIKPATQPKIIGCIIWPFTEYTNSECVNIALNNPPSLRFLHPF